MPRPSNPQAYKWLSSSIFNREECHIWAKSTDCLHDALNNNNNVLGGQGGPSKSERCLWSHSFLPPQEQNSAGWLPGFLFSSGASEAWMTGLKCVTDHLFSLTRERTHSATYKQLHPTTQLSQKQAKNTPQQTECMFESFHPCSPQ